VYLLGKTSLIALINASSFSLKYLVRYFANASLKYLTIAYNENEKKLKLWSYLVEPIISEISFDKE